MATQEVKFTKDNLDRIKHPPGGRERYRDRRFDNLYLEVTAKSKTWRYRKFSKGRNITKTLGTWPQMDYSVALRQVDALDQSVANCPSSYKVGHQSDLSIGGSGSFV